MSQTWQKVKKNVQFYTILGPFCPIWAKYDFFQKSKHLKPHTMIGNDLIFHFKSLPASLQSPRGHSHLGQNWAKSCMSGQAWAWPAQSDTLSFFLSWMSVSMQKNQNETSSPSRDISNQRFLQFDWLIAFWAITRDPDFSQTCGFRTVIENHNIFHFKLFLTKTNDSILHKCPKKTILGTFGQIWAERDFPRKIRLCHFFAFMDP